MLYNYKKVYYVTSAVRRRKKHYTMVVLLIYSDKAINRNEIIFLVIRYLPLKKVSVVRSHKEYHYLYEKYIFIYNYAAE